MHRAWSCLAVLLSAHDPMTGAALATVPGHAVGTVEIIEVEDRVAYAEIVEGGDLRRGQHLILLDPAARSR